MSDIYTPYTYRITSKSTGQHYYGVRYAKGCHPSDLWVTYFTSSKHVKKLIEQYGKDDFVIQIRKKFKTSEQALLWEKTVLTRLKILERTDWLNRNISAIHSNKGRVLSAATKAKISKSLTGRKMSQHHKDKIGKAIKGRILSKEHKEKISNSKKEYHRLKL